MARPCTAAHTARPSARIVQRRADLVADGIGGLAQSGKLVAVGKLAAEHQPRQRRPLGDEAHIGGADIGDAVGFRPGDLGRFDDELAQFGEAFHAQLDQQRLVVGKMAVGRGMADAGPRATARKRQRAQRFFFQDGARRFEQAVAQIAVVIGTLVAAASARGWTLVASIRSLFITHD